MSEKHYEDMHIQPYDVMRSLGILKPYLQGAAIKYLMRAGRKKDSLASRDLQKAMDTVDTLIAAHEEEVPF